MERFCCLFGTIWDISIPAQCRFTKQLLNYSLHHHLGIIAETSFFNQVWESIVRYVWEMSEVRAHSGARPIRHNLQVVSGHDQRLSIQSDNKSFKHCCSVAKLSDLVLQLW